MPVSLTKKVIKCTTWWETLKSDLFGSVCRNSGFRSGSSRFFFIGLQRAAPDGILLCYRRRNQSGYLVT